MPGPIDFGHLVVVIVGALAVVIAADRYVGSRVLAVFCAFLWALLCGACGVWIFR